MLLSDLQPEDLQTRLANADVKLCVGPYVYQLHSNLPCIAQGLSLLYGDFHLAERNSFVDFDIALKHRNWLQRLRSEAEFLFDQQSPFDTIPAEQAYAFLEWGMNWCVSLQANEYLKLHAAVVAKDGAGIIMPGVPGAGKSTLCAALALSDWRVLSDEHALIPLQSAQLIPLCRPVSLKNESIRVIHRFSSSAVFGPTSRNTHKGEVVHMKADLHKDSHDTAAITARLMIFPRYSASEPQQLSLRPRTASFILAAYHSFNYSLLGEAGFDAMCFLVGSVDCFDLVYHDLDWAVQQIENLLS